MKKVLLVCAHPDDEAYGLGATLTYMIYSKKWDVSLLTFTNGVNCKEDNNLDIMKQLNKSCKQLGIKDHLQLCYDDQKLDTYPLSDLVKDIVFEISNDLPDLVLTHNSTDLNLDHRIVFEATMVACRPKLHSPVKEIWTYETPSSTNWGFGEFGSFEPNIFVPAIQRALKNKLDAIRCYPNEIEDHPNARSIQAIISLCKYRGTTVGVDYAEAFKLIRRTI
jgi:LmbE family N-acetylglucosaminyl deacetylase